MRPWPGRVRLWGVIATAVGVLALGQTAEAGGCGCPVCAPAAYGGCGPAFQMVQRTVYVPTIVTERRVVNMTEFQTETRQRTVLVNRCVPETRQVRETYVAMVPEVRERQHTYMVHKPVWREVERQVTVQVPQVERRQGVRHVCRQVQVQEMRRIARDMGHWEDVVCESECMTSYGHGGGCGRPHRRWLRCGGCGGCSSCCGGYDAGCGPAVVQHTHRVWRPNIVHEEVPVTVWRTQVVEEPYEYDVTVFRPEVRDVRVKVCDYVSEERTENVQYTVCVPQRRERVRNVTTYRVVTEEQLQNVTVRVPHQVAREVDVRVCRMVPRQITVKVPVYSGCGRVGCGY